MYDKLHWLGHDSFRIDGDVVIYIDPWKVADDAPAADLILITHEHHDHFSKEDIQKIRRRDTEIVGPQKSCLIRDTEVCIFRLFN